MLGDTIAGEELFTKVIEHNTKGELLLVRSHDEFETFFALWPCGNYDEIYTARWDLGYDENNEWKNMWIYQIWGVGSAYSSAYTIKPISKADIHEDAWLATHEFDFNNIIGRHPWLKYDQSGTDRIKGTAVNIKIDNPFIAKRIEAGKKFPLGTLDYSKLNKGYMFE